MKYQLVCKKCGKVIGDFAAWFNQDQLCECGSNHAEVVYDSDYRQLDELCKPGQRLITFTTTYPSCQLTRPMSR